MRADLNCKGPQLKPFLKWAGNKYRVLKNILPLLPGGVRLIEPFVGSGAVFLNTNYPKYLLSDNNPDLISLFQILQTHGEEFIHYSAQLFTPENNQQEAYYQLRNQFNACQNDDLLRASLFLYLNKHGYNGLCRYNSSGGYNVPFGRCPKPYFPLKELHHFLLRSRQAQFVHQDYQAIMQMARPGDIVYCDPPYAPLSKTAYFTAYNSIPFGLPQQIELAEMAKRLARNKVPVIISNHSTEFTHEIYQGAELIPISVSRSISCNIQKRDKVTEILAVFT
jgi:DNA adenine methylase